MVWILVLQNYQSPSKSILKNLVTADHFLTQNGLISPLMFIFPQITRFGIDFSPSKSQKVLKNRFWKFWSLYTLNYFLTQNDPISALMFIFPHITRFGMDFSPSKSPKVLKNRFWKIWSLYTITFRPKMARFQPKCISYLK